jgi:hypothetical protein
MSWYALIGPHAALQYALPVLLRDARAIVLNL